MTIRPPVMSSDADLTAIAALDSSVAGALVTDGSGWIKKTYAQLKTALSLVKGDVGLGNVDNTADTAKPVSTAQQTALNLKANLASPTFTGTVIAPTPTAGDNSTKVATTAFVEQRAGTLVAYVNHGATAGTARPSTSSAVEWTGSVAPTNAVAGDVWWDTTTDPYTQKIRGASAFTVVGASAYAPARTASAGSFVAFFGDSLVGAVPLGASMPRYATLLSNGRIQYGTNAGVASNTTAQMLARVTDVTTNSTATTVVVLGGTNDASTGVAVGTSIANIDAIVKAIRAAGKVAVLGTIPPKLANRTAVATLNLAIRLYCLDNSVPLIDFYAKLVDPATGDYLAAYQNDGTHPNDAGYAVMGQAVVDALCSGGSMTPMSLLAACDNADGINKLANPLAINISTDIPTSWGKLNNGSGSEVTYSVVTGDTAILGNWAQIVTASATSYRALKNGTGSGYSVGDKLLFQGRAAASGLSGNASFSVQVQFYSASTSQIIQTLKAPFTGAFSRVLTVPASTSFVELQILGSAGSAGSGTFKVAQTGMFNLTTLGLDALGLVAA